MFHRKKLTALALAATLALPMAAQAQDLTIALASEPSSIDPHFHNLGPKIGRAHV